MKQLRENLLSLLGSSVPSLNDIAKYYFLHPSKQLRPLLVLLFAQATNGLGSGWVAKRWHAESVGAGGRFDELDRPLTRPDVLNDCNPCMPHHTTSFQSVFSLTPLRKPSATAVSSPSWQHQQHQPSLIPLLLPTQMRLAQIVEMIHVASLLHDDVIDRSSLRRGMPAAPAAFGNKLSVLAGDFVLARASGALSRLGDIQVIELIAGVIANLVEGEILQMKDVDPSHTGPDRIQALRSESWIFYMRRTYLKTASLIANGARAAVALGGCGQGELWRDVAYAYGRSLGLAFQVSFSLLLSHHPPRDLRSLFISSSTTCLITRRVRPLSVNPVELIYSLAWPRARPCMLGKNTPTWAHSFRDNSKTTATLRSCVFFIFVRLMFYNMLLLRQGIMYGDLPVLNALEVLHEPTLERPRTRYRSCQTAMPRLLSNY